MEPTGKRALITGAAAGIGRATALAFSERGVASVTLCDIDEARLQETAALVEAAGAAAVIRRLDVTDSADFERVFEETRFDIVFNNAGIVSGVPIYPDTPIARIELLVRINVTSVFVGTTLAVAHMRKHNIEGAIVNTASTGALRPHLDDAPYVSSKAAVLMFTQSCKGLQERFGIRVNAVLPGITDTDILDEIGGGKRPDSLAAHMRQVKVYRPSEIADAVLQLVEDEGLAGDYILLPNHALVGADA